MAHCRHLPVWKAALDLVVHLEHAVRRFGKTPGPPRYHKYTLGSELRQTSQRLCRWVARANNASAEGRYAALEQLVLAVEMKTLLTLAQEMQAFTNFNAFAQVTELAVALGRRGGDAGCGLKPQSIADEVRVAVHYPPGLAWRKATRCSARALDRVSKRPLVALPVPGRQFRASGTGHQVVSQTGHFKTGFKQRTLTAVWLPAKLFHSNPIFNL